MHSIIFYVEYTFFATRDTVIIVRSGDGNTVLSKPTLFSVKEVHSYLLDSISSEFVG